MPFARSIFDFASRLSLLLILVLVFSNCDRDGPTRVPVPKGAPFVLISIDTLRSDRLPAYGYDGVRTPAIDRLQADGVLFERAYTPVPLTLPAHASLLTGLLPMRHGVRDNIGYSLRSDKRTLAESFKEAGYRTGAAVSGIVLRRQTGLSKGFDHYEDAFDSSRLAVLGEIQRSGQETLTAIKPWLQEQASQPFFLFFHLYDPHTPYSPGEPFASLYPSVYDGEIAAADAAVGGLLNELDRLGLYDDAVILLTSDHGEGLYEHGEGEHGIFLYRESLQVPLILKLPRSQLARRRVPEPVQLTDIAPTFLDLLRVPSDSDMDGTSLLVFLETHPPERAIYAETFYPQLRLGWSALRSLIGDGFHYIEAPAPELYDLLSDPGERHNILREKRQVYGALKGQLEDHDVELQQPHEADPKVREALLSLGYLGSDVAPEDRELLPDPKDRIDSLRPLDDGMNAFRNGDAARAVPLLEEATAKNPQLVVAWQFLGLALLESARPQEAYEALSEAFRLSKGAPEMAQSLASVALETGHIEEGEKYLQLAIHHKPNDMRLRLVRGRALLELGRLEEGLEIAEGVRQQDPRNADAYYLCGSIKIGLGRLEQAESDLRRALELAPAHTAAMSDLAVLLSSTGHSGEARLLVSRLLEIRPDDLAAKKLLADIDSERP